MAYRYTLQYASRSKAIEPKSVGKITVAREQDEAFFREKMSGGVVVVNEDYNFLRDAEIYAVECCQEITFLIERQTCAGGDYETFWEGYFSLYDVEWDLENQEANIKKVTVRDRYNVIFANWHKEINWLGGGPKRRPNPADDTIQPRIAFTQSVPGSEEYNPSGSNLFNRGFYFNRAILWLAKQTLNGTGSEVYTDITLPQMSQFLTASTNPANGKPNILPDVIMMHLSDAKRPEATRYAFEAKVTLKDVLANLKLLYNAYWFIDEDNHFRIEHLSFFKNFDYTPPGVTLDLTEEQYEEKLVGKKKYFYQSELLKGREGVEQGITLPAYDQESTLWTQEENPSTKEFHASYMSYFDNCVPRDDKGEASEEFKSITLFTTDWRTVAYKPDTVPDEGWMLVHVPVVNAPNAVAMGWLPISGQEYTNGNLAMTRLYYEFGRTDLSFQYGMMSFEKQAEKRDIDPETDYITERPMRAKSTKRVKSFEPIELDLCCGDSDYDFSGYIKHPLDDNCVVEKLEFDLETETVNLSLVSSTSCDNIPFPEYEEIQEPDPGCLQQGVLLRSDLEETTRQDNATSYITIKRYTDYYADGNCGEYTQTRETRDVRPKRQNGPR